MPRRRVSSVLKGILGDVHTEGIARVTEIHYAGVKYGADFTAKKELCFNINE
jgi:hypothetical protein